MLKEPLFSLFGWMTLAIQYGRQYRTLLFLPLGSIKDGIFKFTDVAQFCPNLDHVISYSLRADSRICWTKWKSVQCMLVNVCAQSSLVKVYADRPNSVIRESKTWTFTNIYKFCRVPLLLVTDMKSINILGAVGCVLTTCNVVTVHTPRVCGYMQISVGW